MSNAIDLTAVVVSFQSSGLLGAFRDSFRTASEGLSVELVLVENESTAEERERVRAIGGFDRTMFLEGNRGYAAGVNAGLAGARGAFVLVSNPDVLFDSKAVSLLVRTSRGFGAAVGPRLVFDAAGDWLLPPPSHDSARDEWDRLLGGSFSWLRQKRRRQAAAWIARLRRASDPISVPALPGAVWVVPRPLWERTGGLDEQFPLYFEETDWFVRARTGGASIFVDPSARVRHLFDRSGRGSAEAQAKFRVSEELYWRRHGDPLLRLGRRLLGPSAADPRGRDASFPPLSDLSRVEHRAIGESCEWLLGPSPDLVPAAHADGAKPLPPLVELPELLPAGRWFIASSEIATGGIEPIGYFDASGPRE